MIILACSMMTNTNSIIASMPIMNMFDDRDDWPCWKCCLLMKHRQAAVSAEAGVPPSDLGHLQPDFPPKGWLILKPPGFINWDHWESSSSWALQFFIIELLRTQPLSARWSLDTIWLVIIQGDTIIGSPITRWSLDYKVIIGRNQQLGWSSSHRWIWSLDPSLGHQWARPAATPPSALSTAKPRQPRSPMSSAARTTAVTWGRLVSHGKPRLVTWHGDMIWPPLSINMTISCFEERILGSW